MAVLVCWFPQQLNSFYLVFQCFFSWCVPCIFDPCVSCTSRCLVVIYIYNIYIYTPCVARHPLASCCFASWASPWMHFSNAILNEYLQAALCFAGGLTPPPPFGCLVCFPCRCFGIFPNENINKFGLAIHVEQSGTGVALDLNFWTKPNSFFVWARSFSPLFPLADSRAQ